MSDLIIFLVMALIAFAITSAITLFAMRYRPNWTKGKIAVVAAIPVPSLLFLPSIFLILRSKAFEYFNPEACGLDGCGLDMALGIIGTLSALAIFAVAALLALLIARSHKSRCCSESV